MSSLIPAGSGALLKHPSFLLFLLSRSFSRFSSQIAAVAIGWQIYDMTGSAFDLGMVGLVQFLPTALAGVRRRPRRRPLRAQARHADLPARAGADGGVSRMGRLCRIADGAADLHRDRRAGNGHRVRESGGGGAAAADRSAGHAATRDRAVQRRRSDRHHRRPRAWRPGLCRCAQHALWHDGRVLAVGRDPDRRHPSVAAGCRQGCRRRPPICSPASGSSATIRPSSARSRSTCSPCCSAAPPRCCRSMRAISCRPARSASASCAPRPRSAPC